MNPSNQLFLRALCMATCTLCMLPYLIAQEDYRPGTGYGPRKRAEWYWESRLGNDGKPVNTAALNAKALKAAQKLPGVTSDQRSFSGDWTFSGPATMQPNFYSGLGRVNRIAFHPTDTAIIYAATAGGGLWMTPNHGTVWYPRSDHISVNNVTGVVIHPDFPDTLFILTGDGETGGNNGQFSTQKPSIGVLRSDDGGIIWKPTGLSWDEDDLVAPYDLIMAPNNPNVMFACTSTGLYRTDNGGISWPEVYPRRIYTVRMKPGDPDIVYAVGTDYLYWSNDNGITWIDSVQVPQFEGKSGRMTIDISADNPDLVYLISGPGSAMNAQFRGLYRFNAVTEQFIQMSNAPNLMTLDETGPGDQSGYDLALVCDPDDDQRMMMGAVHMHRSDDGGSTWNEIGKSGANTYHDDIHSLRINPLTGSLYACTDGGIYFSPDFGAHWTFISEYLRITQYYRIAVSQQDMYRTIGGTQDNGTNMKTANHTEFTKIYHKDGMDCAIHPMDDNLMIYSCQNGEFFLSQDGGGSEDSLINVKSLPSTVSAAWVTAVAWDPSNVENIWIGYRPIYRSFDMGSNFEPIDDTIGGRYILHISIDDPNKMYAGDYYTSTTAREFKLWTSDDGGNSWAPCHEAAIFPDSNLVINALTTNPQNANEAWIAVGGWNADQKVYRTLDGGGTWENMTGNLPNTPVNAIIFQDTGGFPDDAVYIGTDIGIFYRNADLGNWKYFSNGLPSVEVMDLEIVADGGILRAGTYGRGIWEADLFSACANFHFLNEFNQFTGHSYEFQANQEIEAQNVLIDGEGSSVLYRAGDLILLKQDFRAKSENGAFFKAMLGPCGAEIE